MKLQSLVYCWMLMSCSRGQSEPEVAGGADTAVVATVAVVPAPAAAGSGSAALASASPSASAAPTPEEDVTLESAMGTGQGFKNETALAKFALDTATKVEPEQVRKGHPTDAIMDSAMTCTDPGWKLAVRRDIAHAIKSGPEGTSLAIHGPVSFVSASAHVVTTYQKDVTYRACTMKVEVSTYEVKIEAKDKAGKAVWHSVRALKIDDRWFLQGL